ncbi:uncharacterized protein EI97DRAFT_235817 [Westerdykella ornata]|uniref:Uncharacterized protein n=1 Tax=Westerdykella ornata TaxID=318751 RepID=A0A6A6J6P7_WESOR|nr:uncharacterized protein EI97DRAFT_235817 [Westerdykella ornata]KAF2272075.1 hypothetical protein EI97DRAFT_235817 [Westerdykella ornata]
MRSSIFLSVGKVCFVGFVWRGHSLCMISTRSAAAIQAAGSVCCFSLLITDLGTQGFRFFFFDLPSFCLQFAEISEKGSASWFHKNKATEST